MPCSAALRKMFSRAVISRWNPIPISSRETTRPLSTARPLLGGVTRDRTRSSVVLPAPLGPITPSTALGPASNETSSSAQNSLGRLGASVEPNILWYHRASFGLGFPTLKDL